MVLIGGSFGGHLLDEAVPSADFLEAQNHQDDSAAKHDDHLNDVGHYDSGQSAEDGVEPHDARRQQDRQPDRPAQQGVE